MVELGEIREGGEFVVGQREFGGFKVEARNFVEVCEGGEVDVQGVTGGHVLFIDDFGEFEGLLDRFEGLKNF